MCIGPIRPRLMSCAASLSAARWRRCSFSSLPGRSFGQPGVFARITALISLAPLDRHQVRHMVGELAARHALPKEVIEGVTERTGGVPLFVEEVTRLLLERGEQGGIQAIPPTLQQSLTARLDRLGPAREVAQIGAVIGRDFSYALFAPWPGWRMRRCKRRWNGSRRPTSCWCRACRRNPTIASSTR